MLTWNNEKNPQYLLADDLAQQKTPEPELIRIGRGTVLQWMQLSIDANAIKLEEAALNLGADHKPAWIATSYLWCDVMRRRSPVCTFSTSATTWSSFSANALSRQPKWICAPLARSAQRRNARSSTICGTLLGISGVGQSEYGRGRRPNSWPQKRVT